MYLSKYFRESHPSPEYLSHYALNLFDLVIFCKRQLESQYQRNFISFSVKECCATLDTSIHLLHRHLGVKTFWFCPFFAPRRRGAFFAGEFEKMHSVNFQLFASEEPSSPAKSQKVCFSSGISKSSMEVIKSMQYGGQFFFQLHMIRFNHPLTYFFKKI